jgi:hypothetical protein
MFREGSISLSTRLRRNQTLEELMTTTDWTAKRFETAVPLSAALDALTRAAQATDELLGAISDTDGAADVPGLAWTVSETAAHLVTLLDQSAAYARGARDGRAERAALPSSASAADRMALGNASELETLAERRISVLRPLLATAAAEFARVIADRGDAGPIETILGQEEPASMSAALVGEQLVHGLDLARAVSRRWSIDPAAARLVLAGCAPMLAAFVDGEAIRQVGARIEVRIVGGPRFTLVLDHGRAAVEPGGGQPDCWIRAQPVPYLLTGYGRVSQWSPLLRGQILAGGRRPWIAARMARYLTSI